MPSVSKSQQRLMGVAYAVKSGSMKLKDVDAEYRDKVKSLVDGMTEKDLKKYASTKHDKLPETVDEAFIGPFVFNDSMSDEELLGMYNGALDGYSNYTKGMHYSKSDYKKAYQEIEKILKKRGVSVDEMNQGAVSLNPGMTIGGMGDIMLPANGELGSGDMPHTAVQVADIDDDLEKKKKKKKYVKNLEMENFNIHTNFGDFLNEAFEEIRDLTKALHFEIDPEKAEEMKIELGRRQGEVTTRKQIEGGDYSLRRFRKEIKYADGKDLGVFLPGSYAAATSKLGDGPHAKKVKKVRFNRKKYDQWIEDVASNDGWKNAFDMAQNAKFEPGLIDWAKKEFRGEDVMQRIQWDIESYAESVVTESLLGRVRNKIGKTQTALKKKWAKKGGYENFGQDEIRKLQDEYDYNSMVYGTPEQRKAAKLIDALDQWAMNYVGESTVTEAFKFGTKFQYTIDDVNDMYGFWGTLETIGYKTKQIEDAWLSAYEWLCGAFDFSEAGALFYLNSKNGRHIADSFYDSGADDIIDVLEGYAPPREWKKWAKEYNKLAMEEIVEGYDVGPVNEKKEDRDGVMKFVKKHMSFVSTTEEFNGNEGGIWVSGEDYNDEFKGQTIYDYYSEDYKNREFGVLKSWEKELNKRGWYSEWYDTGTVMIWPI